MITPINVVKSIFYNREFYKVYFLKGRAERRINQIQNSLPYFIKEP